MERFVALEATCRREMNRLLDSTSYSSGVSEALLRRQYVAIILAAADELGIEGLKYPFDSGYSDNNALNFIEESIALTTRLRLRVSPGNNELSVRLAARTRGRIEMQIAALRAMIQASDRSEDAKGRALAKLDELSVELSQPRVSFGKVMAALAYVSVITASGTSFLADAPVAIATTISLIGQDKQAEEAEAKRLGAPAKPKALPAPEQYTSGDDVGGYDQLDELPF